MTAAGVPSTVPRSGITYSAIFEREVMGCRIEFGVVEEFSAGEGRNVVVAGGRVGPVE
jgi:hypothetical protein